MSKPFLTYQQQLKKLVVDKKLIIDDYNLALEKLRDIGYYALIGGYKTSFRDPMTRVYKNNTTFEDILALYEFDDQLRELLFHYLCQIEKKLRSLISYSFCETYGEQQAAYLLVSNYNQTKKNQQGITKLIRILSRLANTNADYDYLVYQRRVYHNVPLWVLMNAVTFGQLSKMYSFLTAGIRKKVSKNFYHLSDRELEQYLKVLVLYRNVCAHNERLFSHKVYSEIPDTILHSKLGIAKNGNQYLCGKRDLFGVVIAFRYLLTKQDFLDFKRKLSRLIENYMKKSSRLSEQQLLLEMGFPENWKMITKYRI